MQGGVGRYCKKLVNALKMEGTEVLVISNISDIRITSSKPRGSALFICPALYANAPLPSMTTKS